MKLLSLKRFRFIIASFFILSFFSNLDAAHIVGGDVTYTFLRFNADTSRVTFRINFTMYRDQFSGGAPFDNNATFGIFRQNVNGSWEWYGERRGINNGPVEPIPRVDDPCVDEPLDVGVQRSSYIFDVELEIGNTNYMIAYQRCCRNNTIANILDPGETGAVFDVVITPTAQIEGNSSPTFNNFPPIFICGGQALSFDHSATDPEGDVLRYTFCAPFASGGTIDANSGGNQGCCQCVRPSPLMCPPDYDNVIYRPPFTKNAPLAGNPVVSIDNITGEISGIPEINGQYVVGVCVEEFRNGELIGSIRRDFQFNVVTCTPNVFAQLAADEVDDGGLDGKVFFINSCGENTVFIENTSFSENNIFEYQWVFYDPNGDVLLDQTGGRENRDISVTFPGIGDYSGTMILNGGTECSDTANFNISIFPTIDGEYTFAYDTCFSGPVDFQDLTITEADDVIGWSWDFGDGGTSSLKDPSYEFPTPGMKRVTLISEDNNECKDTVVKDILYQPVPQLIIVEPSNFIGCLPADIFFNNLSTPIDTTYDILWDFGDGNFSEDISPTHEYLENGTYSISVDITSPIGCKTSKVFNNWIQILEGPTADFAFSPEDPNVFQQEVQFLDNSSDAGAWQWNFGGLGTSFIKNPSFNFPDTGFYDVTLTAFHPVTNCPDTITKRIDIRPLVKLFMPNAFTPNNDSKNDEFLGNGYYDGLSDYQMQIWNRWGEKIFESDDPRQGWNGQYQNSGDLLPQGVYVYKVNYTGPRGEKESQDGHVTLIR